MKTLLLFLLISISAFSQKKMVLIEGFQGHEIEVSDSLTYSTVKEFYKWSYRMKVDFETNLLGIKRVQSAPMATFKNVYFDRGTIYISSYADRFPSIKRVLILYALGNYYGAIEHPLIILDAENEQRFYFRRKYNKDIRTIINQLPKEKR